MNRTWKVVVYPLRVNVFLKIREEKNKDNLKQGFSTRMVTFAPCPHLRSIWQFLTTLKEWDGLTVFWSNWKDRAGQQWRPWERLLREIRGPSQVGPEREADLC